MPGPGMRGVRTVSVTREAPPSCGSTPMEVRTAQPSITCRLTRVASLGAVSGRYGAVYEMWRRKPKTPVLVDAEAAHRLQPRTFSIPRRVVRETLAPGDYVKLIFKVDPPAGRVEAERMWVEVLGTNGGTYTGRLANKAEHLPDLHPDDIILFGPEHIAARQAGPDDPLYTDPHAFAVVSRRVWDDDAWPSRLERHEIPDAQFSGWFVLAGDETEEFRADRANFAPVPQAALFDRFRVLDSGLEGPLGTTMIWSGEDAEYVRT